MRRVALPALLAVMSFAWAPPGSAAPTESIAAQALERINDFRQRNGLPPMRMEARLASSAQRHADDMAAHGFFDMRGSDGSDFAERVRHAGYAYERIAEHLAVGYPTPATVVAHWIERRESRKFLLDATLTEAGIGYAKAVPARLHQVATRPKDDALDDFWVLTVATPTLPAPGSWHDDVLRRVNEFRAHYGLAALKPNTRLDRAAQSHTDDMARRGYFSHIAPDGSNVGDRAQRAGYDWKRMLENIAAGQPTAEEAVEGWIHSDSHRRAMLDPTVTEAGVGYSFNARNPEGHVHYWALTLGLR